MKKLLILLTAVAITGGSYFLLTQVNNRQAVTAAVPASLDVEEFDAQPAEESAGTEYYENDYDRYDDPTSGMVDEQDSERERRQLQQASAADAEPIDDADAPSQAAKAPSTTDEKNRPRSL